MNFYEQLMDEHRLIEHMVHLIDEQVKMIEEKNEINLAVIDLITDFLKTYASSCHERKEEAILFKKLEEKDIPDSYRETIKVLKADHEFARETVVKIISEREDYIAGSKESLMEIINQLRALVKLYPKHIKKEEDEFYKQAVDYLTSNEESGMIDDFNKLDQELIHKKYQQVVERLENS
ncbi:hypothetical protein GF352_00445 [archaeon]|nr:hypothetical protein [archaeon]